jgi:DnaK suppressor protein
MCQFRQIVNSQGELFMPAVRKAKAVKKRRAKSASAAKPARKKTTRRKKRSSTKATGAVTRRRRKSKVGAKKKTTAKRPRRKTMAKRRKAVKKPGVARKRKTATRGKSKKVAVKKKPRKTQKASTSTRVEVNRKLRVINTTNKALETAKATRTGTKKKQRQVTKSDSQVLPVIEEQPSLETTMATKKTKKRIKKVLAEGQVSVVKTGLESVTEADLNIAPYKEQPGEDYMSADQQAHFRRLLLQRKRILLEDMGRTVHHLQDEGASLPDISDRATQEEEFNLELRARDRERKLIKKIEDALQQLDEGHYGLCISCGVEIGIRRLEARPTATLCIDCKTLDEIREKQMGG